MMKCSRFVFVAVAVALFVGDRLLGQKPSGVRSNRSKPQAPASERSTKPDEANPKLSTPTTPPETTVVPKAKSQPKENVEQKTSTPPDRKPVAASETKLNDNKTRGSMLKTELGDVEIFPADNPWNQDVSKLPVHAKSKPWIESVGADRPLFPCFGADYQGAPNGIPYVVVTGKHLKRFVEFEYPDESDNGPYPIPNEPPIEGGPKAPGDSDRHVIMIDAHNNKLYELFQVLPAGQGNWKAGSGAIFDLTSNKLRPFGWTSADAAGLPIFPGLVRYDETIKQGEIKHALRFTVRRTQRAYVLPATHFASKSNDPNLPPMGLRVRLRADYDISNFPKPAKVILTCLKKYGMLLADNGSDWFITGCPDNRWNDDELHALKRVKGRDLECVDTGELLTKSE